MENFFPHHPHHKHPDVFHNQHSNLHVSIFDDLPAGTTTCSTSFKTGDGGTVHITRTVIGGDGSVRREMRFRTPSTSRAEEGRERAREEERSRLRRQQSEPDGAAAKKPDPQPPPINRATHPTHPTTSNHHTSSPTTSSSRRTRMPSRDQ